MEIPDKAVGTRGSWFVRYWLPLMLYAGLIFFLSSQSHPEQFVPNLFFLKLGDKVLHDFLLGNGLSILSATYRLVVSVINVSLLLCKRNAPSFVALTSFLNI